MPSLTDWVSTVVVRLIELGVLVILLGIVLYVLFGSQAPFIGVIVDNLMGIIGSLHGAGVVGLVAIGVVYAVIARSGAR